MATIYGHECVSCTGTAFGNNDQCSYCIRTDAEIEEEVRFCRNHPTIECLSDYDYCAFCWDLINQPAHLAGKHCVHPVSGCCLCVEKKSEPTFVECTVELRERAQFVFGDEFDPEAYA